MASAALPSLSAIPLDRLDSVLIDTLPVAVYVCDREGRIIRWNTHAVELWGREPSTGDRYCGSLRMIRPDASVLLPNECPMVGVLRTGEAVRDAEVGIERPDGSRITVRVTIVPLTDTSGEIVGACNTFQDITSEKQARDDLNDFVENATEGLHWVGADGTILWANQAELDLLGFARDEYVGHHIAEFHADGQVIKDILDRLSTGQTLRNYEARLRCKDGSLRYVLINSNVLWRDGEFTHTRCFTRDITDLKMSESALRHQAELLRTVADNAASMILMMDTQGRGTYANPEVTRLTGYTADELIGHVLHDKVHYKYPDGRLYPRSECPLDRALALGQSVRELEETFVRKDGTFLPVVCSAMPIVRDGKAVGTVLEVRDITERRRADQALRLSEERFRSLSKCLPVGIFQNDIDGKCTYTNPRAAAICGFTFPESLGDGWANFVHPDDRERLYSSWMAAVTERREWVEENRWLHRDGTIRWTICRAAPHLNDAGDVIGYIGTLEDITERKQAEELLREMDHRKDEFLATLAHELRNPLAPLRNALHVLRLSGASGQSAESMRQMMERQVNHLVRLVDDLLEISRITRGAFELRREVADLRTIVANAVETIDPLIKAAGHRLTVVVPQEPLLLDGDAVRLAQIFANLLHNAARYTDAGGRLELEVRRQGTIASVLVRDNGAGIPPESLKSIFEMFSRGVRTAGRAQGGLGIGLALARRLAEMHGGSIEARSGGIGEGSEFIVELPLLVTEQPPCEPTPEDHPKMLGPSRILVVDDNLDAADSLARVLSSLGADVRVANDGPTALGAFEAYSPHVVLLDIGMPGMDGFEVARRLREYPGGRQAMLVALTGWGQEEDRRRTREGGFNHHLVKPADIAALEELLVSVETQSGAGRRV